MKLPKLSSLKDLKRSSKAFLKKYGNDVSDIFVFGSYVKGRAFPGDIDVCVVFKGADPDMPARIYRGFVESFGAFCHYNWILLDGLMTSPLFPILLFEGYSLLKGKNLSESLGLTSGSVFSYELKGLSQSKKVLFSYTLHGKKSGGKTSGILERCAGHLMGKGVVFIPVSKSREFQDFLEHWNVKYSVKTVLMR